MAKKTSTVKGISKMKKDSSIRSINDFLGARDLPHPVDRLEDVRRRARKFREKMLSGPQVIFYRSYDLIRVPYPTRYALLNAYSLPTPYMHILNRLFIIQYKTPDGIKTLLFSPSDLDGNTETPFFKRLSESFGPFQSIGKKIIAPILNTVEECLKDAGISPEKVDYISYDHLHTQDIRKWLGANGEKGYFPNAKLLVMRQEWDSVQGLLPPQADWYCPNGTGGVASDRIRILDGDVSLGQGVALIRTPGHTSGNHSLVAHTSEGIFVSSENGVSADSYSPLKSRIPGVKKYAKATGMEVILNGNTLESGLEQYISMVQEKEMAGISSRNSDFYNVMPSSEMTSYWLFPGTTPTFSFGRLSFGSPVI
ncbi:hypothetical protein [Leptospira mayottensis]|uniref:Metallo-beta-lactamase domain-containing protein n=2 Tax=Leptospira mayottensis TaxID=1137606 RepID=A0AA87MMD5_9LEPT|nr:hypothetical protein [Leptospira mayottensis]AXR62641.1 hypothetical protein DQM68_18305 [Leptospira mayottensis]AXR66464.1 hypothetical protein DQM28_19910 [Leptospira mayottensis]AXR70017.1 hypothetical protein DPV73_18585 [Leptospira mayottensis]AZQ04024.1 hypothetical protein LEP1GSC190_18380 [Leptospira mayottensis 200901116]EKS00085.1 hypothetical protein LEP1GSC125_3513 [Leptospira mayottensis 200901122]